MLNNDWIPLLEVTDLPQCRNILRDGSAYCALGLGAKMLDRLHECTEHSLSASVQKALGINEDTYELVVAWNDDDGLSFKEIAKRLRSL